MLPLLPALILAAAAVPPAPANPTAADVAALVKMMDSPVAAARDRAAATLTQLGPTAIPAALDAVSRTALTGKADRWLTALSGALAHMGRPAAAPLGEALDAKGRDVFARVTAAAALESLGPDAEPAVAALGRALDDDPAVSVTAALALRHVGAPALPALVAALGRSPRACEQAVTVLAELKLDGDPLVEQALRALPPDRQAVALADLGSLVALDDARHVRAAALYQRALAADAALPAEPRRTALLFLVRFHTEKGDDTAAAPFAAHLLESSPDDADTVQAVAESHVHFGRPDAAEKLYRGRMERAHDARSCRDLASFLDRRPGPRAAGRAAAGAALDACRTAAPKDVDLLHAVAVQNWEWAYRDTSLDDSGRAACARRGLAAVDAELALAPDRFEALVYKALLVRVQASMEADPARRQALVEQAMALQKRALEVKKRASAAEDAPR